MLFLEGHSRLENQCSSLTLRQLLEDLFQRSRPEDICGRLGDNQLTIEMLSKGAKDICLKMRNESCVGICMDLSLELIILLCGLILSGIPYVPLEPRLPEEHLNYILQDSQPSILIKTDQKISSHWNENIPTITFEQLINQKFVPKERIDPCQGEGEGEGEEEMFCLMYTSGSTGRPKGVRLPCRALLNRLNWQWKMFPFDENEVCCLKTSISFVDSISEIFAPLLRGIPLIIIQRSLLLNINQLINVFNSSSLTRLIVVPSFLRVLLEYLSIEKKQIQTLRFVISSGESLSADLIERFFQIFGRNCQLLNFYGSTEVMGDVTFEVFSSIDDLNEKCFQGRISIGKPIDNMRIDIFNPNDQNIGEILVSGEGVASGYHHEQIIQPKFISDPNHPKRFSFRTGDMAQIWNGNLILFGRSDNQVKIAGNRVNLNEIEFQLKNHCNCREPIAIFLNGEIFVFILENENENVINLDRNSLSRYLPTYSIPSAFFTLSHFPLLVSGKIDRNQLLDLAKEKVSLEGKKEFSSQTIEIFSHALEEFGISRSNIDRNFFAAGGSSLNALLIVAKLHAKGFTSLTVERLISAPSLRYIELDLSNSINQTEKYFDEQIEHKHNFTFIPLEQVEEDIAFHILTESFLTHGEIDTLIHQHQSQLKEEFRKEWRNLMEFNWNTYRNSQLSFGVIDHNSHLIGLSLSYDINSPPPSPTENSTKLLKPLNTFIDLPLLNRIEQLTKDEHLTRIMRSHITTVHHNLNPAQRLTTMYFIEKHLLDLAKQNNYQAVVTANTSSVTQQLAEHVLKYHTHHTTLAHQAFYPNTQTFIFPHAPHHYQVTISVKYIEQK